MPRPKPPEPLHQFHLRIPASLYRRLSERAATDNQSINATVRMFCEAALLGSTIITVDTVEPEPTLPWMDVED